MVYGDGKEILELFGGNIFITPQKIYWSRKDHTYLKYDIDRYLCSSDYIVDYRGTGKSIPGEYSKIYENDDRTYNFARFRLIDKQCDYSKVYNSHISKDIAFIQLATPSNNRGGLVGIRTYRSNGIWMGNYSAIKIHHYRK